MQDPNPLPWGAQDRFQAHFIVKQDPGDKLLRFTARTNLKTTGHFGSKKITGVTWDGGELAEPINDATIYVDPTDNGIRIYGKWKNSHDFSVTKELFEIYDKIAGYVKKLN